jgi:CheY-like chemotaxis protein
MMIEQLGHSIKIANNGQEAIELAGCERFDLILMDCQMPVLDGYETTRIIRSGLATGVSPRIPIIALTAYAMPGDRAKVIDAGMDDYISKPFEAESLNAALVRCGLLQSVRATPASKLSAAAAPSAPVKDTKTLGVKSVFDRSRREQLLKMKSSTGVSVWDKAMGIFMKEMPGRIQQLTSSATAHEADPIAALAHTIAGSAANLGGTALRSASVALEAAAKGGDWAEIQTALAAVELAWTDIQAEQSNTATTTV